MADQCEGESPELGGRRPLCCLPHFPGLPGGSFPLGLQKRGSYVLPHHRTKLSAVPSQRRTPSSLLDGLGKRRLTKCRTEELFLLLSTCPLSPE